MRFKIFVNLFDRYQKLNKNNQDILWNFGSFVVLGFCGIAINFIIAHYYNPEVLGVYTQIYAIYIVFSQFSAAGVHLSALKYVAQYSNEPTRYKSIIMSALVLSVVMAGTGCLILWLLRTPLGSLLGSPDVAIGLMLAIPGLFFFSINKVFFSLLNAFSRMKVYAVFQAMRYVLIMLIVFLSAKFGALGKCLSIALSVAEFILLISVIPFIRNEISRSGFKDLWWWLKKHFNFGKRAFMSNVLLSLNPRMNILILGYFSSDYAVGVFSLAASAAEGLYQLPVVLRTNLNPILVRLLHEEKKEELQDLSRRSMRLTYLSMSVVGILVIFLYPVGLNFVANKTKFMESWLFFAVMVSGIMASSGYIPFSNILMMGGFAGFHTIMISILVLFNNVTNIILVPLMGGMGAAIATAISYVLLIPLVKVFAKRILSVKI